MKKILVFFAIALMVAASIACEGKPGKDGNDAIFKILDFDVESEEWNEHDGIFKYDFPMPEFSGKIFDEGAVVCYLLWFEGSVPVQSPLPYTFFGVDEDIDGNDYFYSENYTFEVKPGYITFIVKISDFQTGFQQPLPCSFRVVLLW